MPDKEGKETQHGPSISLRKLGTRIRPPESLHRVTEHGECKRNLDFGYAFATADGDVGRIQESEVRDVGWYPLPVAERLVGHRIRRAVSAPATDWLTGPR